MRVELRSVSRRRERVVVDGEGVDAVVYRFGIDVEPRADSYMVEEALEAVEEWLRGSRLFRSLVEEAAGAELRRVLRSLPRVLEDALALRARWVGSELEVAFSPEEAPRSTEELRRLVEEVVVDEVVSRLPDRVVEAMRRALREALGVQKPRFVRKKGLVG